MSDQQANDQGFSYFVEAIDDNGNAGVVDAMDLDSDSFKRAVLFWLHRAGLIVGTPASAGTPWRVKPGISLKPS